MSQWKRNRPTTNTGEETPWFVQRLLEIAKETNDFIQKEVDPDLAFVGSEMQAGPNFKCAKGQLMENGEPVGPVIKMTMFARVADRRGHDVQLIGLEIAGNEHVVSADPFVIAAVANLYADMEEADEQPDGAELIGAGDTQ